VSVIVKIFSIIKKIVKGTIGFFKKLYQIIKIKYFPED